MRKEKKIELGGKEYVIKELTQKEIYDLLSNYANLGTETKDKPWYIAFASQIPKIAGIDYNDWMNFTPSETIDLINALKEVNASFLAIPDLLEQWGLAAVVQQFKAAVKQQIEQVAKAIQIVPSQSQELEAQLQANKSSSTEINAQEPIPIQS